jgi:hypothetical protein
MGSPICFHAERVGLGVDGAASNEDANLAVELTRRLLARVAAAWCNGRPERVAARDQALNASDATTAERSNRQVRRRRDLRRRPRPCGDADQLAGLAPLPARAEAGGERPRGGSRRAPDDAIGREIAATSARLRE